MLVGDQEFKVRRIIGYTHFNLLFIGFIIVIPMVSAIGGSTVISNDLEPGEMIIYESNLYDKATLTGGTVVTHFFNSRPQVLGFINYTYSDSQNIGTDGDYVYWEDYYASGSTVDISWTSDTEIDFFVIIGKGDFDKWADGDSTQIYASSGTSGILTYLATSDDHIYFALENTSFNSITVQVEFQINVPIFDKTSADKSITGSFSDEDIDHNFIVVENIGLSSADYTLELNNSTSSDNSNNADSDDGSEFPIPISYSSIFLAIFVLSMSKRKSILRELS